MPRRRMLTLLIAVVVAAIVFDYVNGFHDAANAIATVVSTGVAPIRTAVFAAGILNFVGAMHGTAVAKTIASGFADPHDVTQHVVLAALLGAIIWNLITWWYGIPSSSSHALIGGLAGAVVAHAGLGAFKWGALKQKVLVPLVVSPTAGFFVAFFIMVALLWIFRKSKPAFVRRTSKWLQVLSASLMAEAHGRNDAQKSMGIITIALVSYAEWAKKRGADPLPAWAAAHGSDIPQWVIVSCAAAIALGTMAGGERIIKTMGTKIIHITPLEGFAAETTAALVINAASAVGAPVSTTHCVNACIMGVGASKRLSAVRWSVASRIVWAWILTLPAAGALAFVCEWVLGKAFAGIG
jgi:PiT family inorganic phosphate transporter